MFGQVGFFHKFAGKDYEDKRPRDRYTAEARRLLAVLDKQLAGRDWIMGEQYTIADIATFPWVRNWWAFMPRVIWWGGTTSSTCSACWRPLWRGRRWCAGWPFRRRRRAESLADINKVV